MGYRQCLPLSDVRLKDKHCQKPHCRNGVVDTFEQDLKFSQNHAFSPIKCEKVSHPHVYSEPHCYSGVRSNKLWLEFPFIRARVGRKNCEKRIRLPALSKYKIHVGISRDLPKVDF